MKKSMQLNLRAGEKLYINGAVVRFDRKVCVELMNDVTFLMENHVMQLEETTTPLRQLYFVAQAILMDPSNAGAARNLFFQQLAALFTSFRNLDVLHGLDEVGQLVESERVYDALRALRGLFPIEEAILADPHCRPPRAA